MASAAEAARHIFISERRFWEKLDLGIVSRQPRGAYDLDVVRQEYLAHLGEVAGRFGDDAPELARERARLASAQSDAQEMKNAESRRQLLAREDVGEALTAAFGRVRAKLSALPAELAPEAFGRRSVAEVRQTLQDGVWKALSELAAMRVAGRPRS
jgi:phage terminase Nu1 subunit (DNA packaging protein)